MFIDTSASMCCECVCAIVSDYSSVYSLIRVCPCVGSECSLIQVRPCVVSVCVPLLVIMLHCSVCSLIQVRPCVVSVCLLDT